MRSRRVFAAVAPMMLAAACSGDPDDTANVIGPNKEQVFREVGVREDAATDAGVEGRFPAAYRFECIHIHKLGEPNEQGAPPFQAGFLNSLWTGDIAEHRLNILIGIESLDTAAAKAQVYIGSGIGVDDASQCKEPSTADREGTRFESGIELERSVYAAAEAGNMETCIRDAAEGAKAIGTVDVAVPSEGAIYIYAQNDKAVPFNCTPNPDLPNAVPLREVRATVTVDEFGDRIAGQLTACLTEADIGTLCSCIRDCTATDPQDTITEGQCAGCPKGGITLAAQLAGLRPSPDCQARTGGPGFELNASFHAVRLPHQPMVCQ